ncbi:hypothetical protein GCM10009647_083800 [Streptomyces sanglieri]
MPSKRRDAWQCKGYCAIPAASEFANSRENGLHLTAAGGEQARGPSPTFIHSGVIILEQKPPDLG